MVRTGTHEGWVELLPRLRRFALSLTGDRADADDLLQNTAERALARGIPQDADPLKWLFRVCRNLWIDELRGRKVRARHVDDPARIEPDDVGVEAGADHHRAYEEVIAAMRTLSDEHREVLALVAIEGCSYREAATVLGVPTGTVMSRLSRARATLAERLQAGDGGAGDGSGEA